MSCNVQRDDVYVQLKGFQVFLLAYLEVYFHGISVVFQGGKAAEVSLDVIPLSLIDEVFEVLHVEAEARFLFQPAGRKQQHTLWSTSASDIYVVHIGPCEQLGARHQFLQLPSVVKPR